MKFEKLEDRCPAAAIVFDTIAPDTISVGETFELDIYVREYDPGANGVSSFGLELTWEDNAFSVVEWESSPYLLQKTGRLDSSGIEISGFSSPFLAPWTRPIGNRIPEKAATVTLIAFEDGEQTIKIDKGFQLISTHLPWRSPLVGQIGKYGQKMIEVAVDVVLEAEPNPDFIGPLPGNVEDILWTQDGIPKSRACPALPSLESSGDVSGGSSSEFSEVLDG